MTTPFTRKLSVPTDVLIQGLQGEAVLLNVQSGWYFGLDEVGTRMWTRLTSAGSIEHAFAVLLEEYEVEPEQLRQDLYGLVDKLVEHGLVQVSDG